MIKMRRASAIAVASVVSKYMYEGLRKKRSVWTKPEPSLA